MGEALHHKGHKQKGALACMRTAAPYPGSFPHHTATRRSLFAARLLPPLHRRALLLKEALEEVSKSKRNRYESWRRRALGGIKVGACPSRHIDVVADDTLSLTCQSEGASRWGCSRHCRQQGRMAPRGRLSNVQQAYTQASSGTPTQSLADSPVVCPLNAGGAPRAPRAHVDHHPSSGGAAGGSGDGQGLCGRERGRQHFMVIWRSPP